MNKNIGWIVAVVVALAAITFYFWPQLSQAPAGQQTATTTPTSTGQSDTAQMAGTWRSTTDAKFTREFRADGVIYDRYEGDATAGVGGTWGVVLDPSREPMLAVLSASLAGKTVIKAVWEDGAETTFFTVDSVSNTSMTTTDLSGRGAVTVYTKVN